MRSPLRPVTSPRMMLELWQVNDVADTQRGFRADPCESQAQYVYVPLISERITKTAGSGGEASSNSICRSAVPVKKGTVSVYA